MPGFPIRLRPPRRALAATALIALAGCASTPATDNFLGLITPYRIDIVQGNVVTAEQAAQVRPGMTRIQVRDILGTPMLTDIFHAERWDYVFTIKRPGTEPQRRAIVAYFKDDRLERLDAPSLPSEREFVATIAADKGARREAPVLELSEEQRKALPVPPRAEVKPPPASGPVRSYPPLEPS